MREDAVSHAVAVEAFLERTTTPGAGRGAPIEYLRDPRRAITEGGVLCLVCGASFRHLTNTHLRKHGLTSEEYKRRFGYNMRRALMMTPVRRRHADNAKKFGLARRIRRRPILEGLELRRMGGRHFHSLEESLTRRERPPQRPAAPLLRDGRGRFRTAAGLLG